jgi:hypothetical protein
VPPYTLNAGELSHSLGRFATADARRKIAQTVLLQASGLLNKGANHGKHYCRYRPGTLE